MYITYDNYVIDYECAGNVTNGYQDTYDMWRQEKGSTDQVTLCEVPWVAPESNREKWRDGERGNHSLEVSPGHSENSLSHLYMTQRSCQVFYTRRQASGRHVIQPRQEEGREKRLKRVEAC